MPKCHQPLKFSDLNSFLTKFCDNYQRHDYSSCLQWHSNMSPQFSQVEVKKKHLRRVPVKLTGPDTAVLLYENEKCPNPDTCPEKSNCNKCHNEKEFMYHPLVYMTAKCNNGPQCKNRSRFCAFYHTEAERIEAERNRESLLQKINRGKMIKRQPSAPPSPSISHSTSDKPVQSQWAINGEGPTVVEKLKAQAKAESQLKSDSSQITNEEIDDDDNDESSNINTIEHSDSTANGQYSENIRTSGQNIPPGFQNRFGNSSQNGQSISGNVGNYNTSSNRNRDMNPILINEKLKVYPSKILSTRSFGILYEGIYLENGIKIPVCVKEIELRYLGDDILSIEFISRFKSRNMITYYTVCYKDDRAYIVMDLHTQTLASLVRDNHSLLIQPKDFIMTPLCKSILNQLCNIVVTLQIYNRTAHCDLLPQNIFIEMEQEGNARLIIGDPNRSIIREKKEDNYTSDKNRKNIFRYNIPGNTWISPEERNRISLTEDQMFQSDMWRLGMLIFYILTGEVYNLDKPPKNYANIFVNSQPWSTLSSLLLQKDYSLRMSADMLFEHPAFWHFNIARVGAFYNRIYVEGSSIDIQNLIPSIESYALFPRKNWIDVIIPQGSNDNQFYRKDNSLGRLLQLIVNMINGQENDEYYNIVKQQCDRLRINPLQFFHQNFPCLIFKLWEMIFQEQRRMQKQHNSFSELLSC